MSANLGTHFSAHTHFQSYQETTPTRKCEKKEKGKSQCQVKENKDFSSDHWNTGNKNQAVKLKNYEVVCVFLFSDF